MLMSLFAAAAIGVYSALFLWCYKDLLDVKRIHTICYPLTVLIACVIELLAVLYLHSFGVIVFLVIITLIAGAFFHTNRCQSLYIGSFFVIAIYSSRGVIAAGYALVTEQTLNQVLQTRNSYCIVLIIAVLLSVGIWVTIRKTIASKEKMKRLFNNREQLFYVAIYQMLYLIFLLLVNDGLQWNLRYLWYTNLYLISNIISKVVLFYVLFHATRVSELLEYEVYTVQLQAQLARQLEHYRSYRKYTESFRKFKHDYKELMVAVKIFIHNNENEKALCLIDDIHDIMQKTVLLHKTYSNNYIIDAMMQETANSCMANQIRFSATVPMPSRVPDSDLNLIRSFTNITKNAIEACCKIPVPERFIEVIGHYDKDWLTIQVTNSYDGTIFVVNGELRTTKKNRDSHGLRLSIVKNIVEDQWGGMVFTEVNREKRIFGIKLYIPLTSLEES